jgi:hypothetical protein
LSRNGVLATSSGQEIELRFARYVRCSAIFTLRSWLGNHIKWVEVDSLAIVLTLLYLFDAL